MKQSFQSIVSSDADSSSIQITLTKYSHKNFSDYLANENNSTIFMQPTDKEEIAIIKFSLNSNKASGPTRIPYRILLLLKNEISKQLAD